MNAHPQKTSAMNNTRSPELLKTPASEENAARQFGSTAKLNLEAEPDEQASTERQPTEKNKAVVERCMRTGEIMKVLFPGGVQLKSEHDFATFRLFDGLVGSMAHFAQTGMKHQSSLHAISLQANLLEDVIASSDKP
jgi:hypothetical protein